MTYQKWTEEEDKLLIKLWPHSVNTKDILDYFPKRKKYVLLDNRAALLKLLKLPEVLAQKKKLRSERQSLTNKNILGRDLSLDKLEEIAKIYSSKTEFRKLDGSAYATALRLNVLDKICSHMLVNVGISFPQIQLLEIVKQLFPGYEIRCNDRKAIYPKEIDVYIPNLKVGFEYDGRNFHNEKADKKKNELCKSKDIVLFRILERCKKDTLSDIRNQLVDHGFNLDNVDFDLVSSETLKALYSIKTIEEITNSYTNYRKFINEQPKLLNVLRINNIYQKYTNHMFRDYKASATDEEILVIISNANNKEDVIKHQGAYLKMMKNKHFESYKKYKNLPSKNAAKRSGV